MAKLNVSKWQAARRPWNYSPVMQFSRRLIEMALFEATRVAGVPCMYGHDLAFMEPLRREIQLWDAAVMARDWIRRPAPSPEVDLEGYYLSFDHCCDVLGLKADYEREWMLAKIDDAADFDTDECWARVQELTDNPPDEVDEEVFDAVRVVPALDQGNLFAGAVGG